MEGACGHPRAPAGLPAHPPCCGPASPPEPSEFRANTHRTHAGHGKTTARLGQSGDAQTPARGISAAAWRGHRPCCARQGRPGPHTRLHTCSSEEQLRSLFQSVKQIQKAKQSSLSSQLLSDASPAVPPTLPSLAPTCSPAHTVTLLCAGTHSHVRTHGHTCVGTHVHIHEHTRVDTCTLTRAHTYSHVPSRPRARVLRTLAPQAQEGCRLSPPTPHTETSR